MNIVAWLGAIITCTMKVGKGKMRWWRERLHLQLSAAVAAAANTTKAKEGFFCRFWGRVGGLNAMQHAFYDGRTFYHLINRTCATGMESNFHSWCVAAL